jgi:hypothetical protein
LSSSSSGIQEKVILLHDGIHAERQTVNQILYFGVLKQMRFDGSGLKNVSC